MIKTTKVILVSLLSLTVVSAVVTPVAVLMIARNNNSTQQNGNNINYQVDINPSSKIFYINESYQLEAILKQSVSNVSYEWKVTSGNASNISLSNDNTKKVTFRTSISGTYQLAVSIKDASGKELTKKSISIQTYVKPVASITNPNIDTTLYTNQTYQLEAKLSSTLPNVTYQWSVSPSDNITLINANSAIVSFNASVATSYIFKLSITDANGEIIDQQTTTIPIIQSTNPTYNLTISGEQQDFYVYSQYTISATISPDVPNAFYEWTSNNANELNLTANNNIITIYPKQSGNYTINLVVWDSASKNKQFGTKTISIGVKGYEISISPQASYDVNTNYSLNATVNPTHDDLTYSWTCSDNNLKLSNTNTLTVSFSSSVASYYELKLEVTKNGNLVASKTVNINIIDNSQQYQLVIDSDSDLSNLFENENHTLEAILTPAKSDAKYQWTISPDNIGITVNNSKKESYINFNTNLAGTYLFKVEASDSSGAIIASQTQEVIVKTQTSVTPTITASIVNNNQDLIINQTYDLSVVVNPSGDNYYYQWTGDNSLNIQNANQKNISINPQTPGTYSITVNVYSDSNKNNLVATDTISLQINDDNTIPPIVNYELSWNNFSVVNNLNTTYTLTANLTNAPDSAFYEWTTNNSALVLTDYNTKTVSYQTAVVGDYELTCTAYEDNTKQKILATKTAYLSFNDQDTLNLTDLLVDDIKLATGTGGFGSEAKFKEKFNAYGVLKTYSLTTYMYLRSEFTNRGFENVYYQLVKNDSYDNLSFRIFGIATKDISDWGNSICISTLVEDIVGFEVKAGDKVDITLRFNRSSETNKGTNSFDLSTCYFKNANVTSKRDIYWGSPINNIKPFYTTGWDSYATLKINNALVKDAGRNNRTVFAFAYNDGSTNYFVDKRSISW